MKKYLLISGLLFLLPTLFITPSSYQSYFSPSSYKTLLSRSYDNMIWLRDKMRYTYQKFTGQHKSFEQEQKKQFEKKETKSLEKPSIADPKYAAHKFKKALGNKPFFFGASLSHYQSEGGLDEWNANAKFYKKEGLVTAGNAIDFWNKYKNDIPQLKEDLGINMLRISIAWERVQKALDDQYDPQALATYQEMVKTLKDNGIEPFVCLHHYTVPEWFDKAGSFEKEENIKRFVYFAKKMYEFLGEYVTYWSTFNSIEGYTFKGYFKAEAPPAKKDMQLTQQVMANMLEAHVQIYEAIKELHTKNSSWPKPQVGIQKNIIPLDPAQANPAIRSISAITSVMGEAMQNQGFFSFFSTNTYYIWVPGMAYVSHYNKKASGSLDWIGINIYSNMEMKITAQQNEVDEDRKTENTNYRDYPEGIYRAAQVIKPLADQLDIPIIITENGIATKDDETGDVKRERFFRRTLYVIKRLINKEKYNIIGYLPWSSHDNYEWPIKKDGKWLENDPFTSRRYGFFRVEFDKTKNNYLERKLKKGAEYYRDFIKAFKETNYTQTPSWKE